MRESSRTDLIVYRLDKLEFFFERLTLILRVNVLQCLIIQVLKHEGHIHTNDHYNSLVLD